MKRRGTSRKLKISIISLVVGLALNCSFLSGIALADRSLTMDQIIVDAQVRPDASMLVTERITVDFSGQWNGFYVKIPQGDTPITEVQVSENGQP